MRCVYARIESVPCLTLCPGVKQHHIFSFTEINLLHPAGLDALRAMFLLKMIDYFRRPHVLQRLAEIWGM